MNKHVSFANYLLAYYRSMYAKLWIQVASVFTITFIVFCLSMLLAGSTAFFQSAIFTAGAALSLPGLYLPLALLTVARMNYRR